MGYAWNTQFENNPPFVEERNNYTGSYRRVITVPADWKGEQIFLHVGSATSNLKVWVNGKFVGYSEDSKMAAEFDLTKYLKPGKENLIAMQVMRWCDGSYLEDQDFWRFTGLAREVYLYARPQAHVEDIFITPDLVNNYVDGVLDIKMSLDKASGKLVKLSLCDPSGKEVLSKEAKVGKDGKLDFRMEVKYKCVGTDKSVIPYISSEWCDDKDRILHSVFYTDIHAKPSSEWSATSFNFTTPDQLPAYLRVRICIAGSKKGKVLYDDFVIREIPRK